MDFDQNGLLCGYDERGLLIYGIICADETDSDRYV
jgi:hypothetical protein